MKFTFWAVIAPFLAVAVMFLLFGQAGMKNVPGILWVPITLWFWCGVVVTPIYWLVRLVKTAWRA